MIEEFLACSVFAVAGSFRSKSRFAYKILLDLLKQGKTVYPVNPAGGTVEGISVYKKIQDIPDKVEAVSIVTPPQATEQVVKDCKDAEVKYVWMQPGAESEEAVWFCRDNSITVIYNACLLKN